MRVLLVNDYGMATGGAEYQILALRDHLRQRGLEARLFTSRAQYGRGEVLADYQCFGTTSRMQPLIMAANPSAFWQFRQAIAEFKPHVIHLNMFMWQLSPIILPLVGHIPTVYHVQMYNPICPLGTKLLPSGDACHTPAGVACYVNKCFSLQAWLMVMAQMQLWQTWSHKINYIVATSEAVRQRLMTERIHVKEVIGNGVPIRPQRPPLTSLPTVAFAGRLVREKGVDTLLLAFAKVTKKIPDAQLILAGAGIERHKLEKMISDLGLSANTMMVGHVPRTELETLLARAWVQAVPSLWEEPFGMVTTEAMMRGTAVVASAIGALNELVYNGLNGLLVPPGNAEALAEALLQMLSHQELAEALGRAGRAVALAQYSTSVIGDRFIHLYEALCERGAKAHGN